MLSKAQEKLIKSLHTKKGREKSGLCLVEGIKVIETAGNAVEYTFTENDTVIFDQLVTTETPQNIAGIAKSPQWKENDIQDYPTIIVLDGVQDPGNLGGIFRLCLGFNASLLLIDSVDPTNSKVIRSSVGAIFSVPFLKMNPEDGLEFISKLNKPVYRLEKTEHSIPFTKAKEKPAIIIAGSEGNGISLPLEAQSIFIDHNKNLESLNVANVIAIVLQNRF